jgi:hypothetical protein
MVTLHLKTEVNVKAVTPVFSVPGDPEMRKPFISEGREMAENLPFSRRQNRVTIPNYVSRKTRPARIMD